MIGITLFVPSVRQSFVGKTDSFNEHCAAAEEKEGEKCNSYLKKKTYMQVRFVTNVILFKDIECKHFTLLLKKIKNC